MLNQGRSWDRRILLLVIFSFNLGQFGVGGGNEGNLPPMGKLPPINGADIKGNPFENSGGLNHNYPVPPV